MGIVLLLLDNLYCLTDQHDHPGSNTACVAKNHVWLKQMCDEASALDRQQTQNNLVADKTLMKYCSCN